MVERILLVGHEQCLIDIFRRSMLNLRDKSLTFQFVVQPLSIQVRILELVLGERKT